MTGIMIYSQHVSPSANRLFANRRGNGKGRVKSDHYKTWIRDAGYDFAGHGHLASPFTCLITVDRSRRHPLADIDNKIKPVLDLLQTHNIIENDRLCEDVRARWGSARGGMSVLINQFRGNELCPYCGR